MLRKKNIVLTNAQFKALPTTPVIIVPSRGSGTIIRWVEACVFIDAAAGAYIYPSGAIIQLGLVGGEFPKDVSGFVEPVSGADRRGAWFPKLNDHNSTENYLTVRTQDVVSEHENKSLAIGDFYNGVADYTGGHANNTAQVSVTYLVFNTAKGKFL